MNIYDLTRAIMLYWGQDALYFVADHPGEIETKIDFEILNVYSNNPEDIVIQPLLIPLNKMSDEQVLQLCKFASPNAYGDYRYSKWEVCRECKVDGYWEIRNPKVDVFFEIHTLSGKIKLYEVDTEEEPLLPDVNEYYWGWYYEHGIDIPLYPWGRSLIDMGIALDKTKYNGTESNT